MSDKLLNELETSSDARQEAVWFIENVFGVVFGDEAVKTVDARKSLKVYFDALNRLDELSQRLPFHLADIESEQTYGDEE